MSNYAQTQRELEEHLREQFAFLRASSLAYDAGQESEAKRLALTLRTLLRSTSRTQSLLDQLHIRQHLSFRDTAHDIDPRNMAPSLCLIVLGGDGAYHPFCWTGVAAKTRREKPFGEWWDAHVIKDTRKNLFSRKDLVLNVADKDGGAHVDAAIGAAYADLTRRNSAGWMVTTLQGQQPPRGSVALASVRQIAWELEQTFVEQLTQILS